ncbi:hypothetical protein ACIOD1_33185 [Streptomyces sp. NPDC088097]|uniref:hypothetical protein n=1 Tax=Streptomyces sp. NPDC088097 TaxID=3365823 RepID=UPI003816A8CA
MTTTENTYELQIGDEDGDGIPNYADPDFDLEAALAAARRRELEKWTQYQADETAKLADWAELTAEEIRLIPRADRTELLGQLPVKTREGLAAKLTPAVLDGVRAAILEYYTMRHYKGVTQTWQPAVDWLNAAVAQDMHSPGTVLAYLPAERLAELIEPLDDDTTRGLSKFLVDKQQAIVEEANKRAAMGAQDRRVYDAFNSAPDAPVKATTPAWKVSAFRWHKKVDQWGGFMWLVDKFPPNYAFTDVSSTDEDWYAPMDGPNWEQCLRDRGTAEWLKWTFDKRSGLYIRSEYLTAK